MGDDGKKMELSEIFTKKSKKNKPKAVNLNSSAAGVAKPDEPKQKGKAKGDDPWKDDSVTATEMKVQALANFDTADDKKEDADASGGMAWNKKKQQESALNQSDKQKYPTLEKAALGKMIAMQEDREAVGLKIHKNKFGALDDEEDADASKPATRTAPSRTAGAGLQDAAPASAQAEAPSPEKKKAPEQKKVAKKVSKENKPESDDEPEKPAAADTLIQPDLAAAKSKYADRRRLPLKDLPPRENKNSPSGNAPKKNKGKAKVVMEDDEKPLYAPDDW